MSRKATYLTAVGATLVLLLAVVGTAPAYMTSDGALWIGALVGVVAFGLVGDTIVGIAILGVAAVGDAVAFVVRRLVARDRRAAAESPKAPRIERAKLLQR